jgi:2-hydroxychromene-2-carboxylate isomerase
MSKVVDYYLSPSSPWTYLGHERFTAIARAAGASVNMKPVDLGRVFSVSGGLPLKQRPPQRQAYRMMELKRWRTHLDVPLTLEPKYFPYDTHAACLFAIAALPQGTNKAMQFMGAVLRGCWAEEKNMADTGNLAAIADILGLDGARLLEQSRGAEAATTYERFSQEAITAQVFGAPTFIYRGEAFWGQDRLDFLERALQA